ATRGAVTGRCAVARGRATEAARLLPGRAIARLRLTEPTRLLCRREARGRLAESALCPGLARLREALLRAGRGRVVSGARRRRIWDRGRRLHARRHQLRRLGLAVLHRGLARLHHLRRLGSIAEPAGLRRGLARLNHLGRLRRSERVVLLLLGATRRVLRWRLAATPRLVRWLRSAHVGLEPP